jgi:hypothetical protein
VLPPDILQLQIDSVQVAVVDTKDLQLALVVGTTDLEGVHHKGLEVVQGKIKDLQALVGIKDLEGVHNKDLEVVQGKIKDL